MWYASLVGFDIVCGIEGGEQRGRRRGDGGRSSGHGSVLLADRSAEDVVCCKDEMIME